VRLLWVITGVTGQRERRRGLRKEEGIYADMWAPSIGERERETYRFGLLNGLRLALALLGWIGSRAWPKWAGLSSSLFFLCCFFFLFSVFYFFHRFCILNLNKVKPSSKFL
jgi:hypothetical protein